MGWTSDQFLKAGRLPTEEQAHQGDHYADQSEQALDRRVCETAPNRREHGSAPCPWCLTVLQRADSVTPDLARVHRCRPSDTRHNLRYAMLATPSGVEHCLASDSATRRRRVPSLLRTPNLLRT